MSLNEKFEVIVAALVGARIARRSRFSVTHGTPAEWAPMGPGDEFDFSFYDYRVDE